DDAAVVVAHPRGRPDEARFEVLVDQRVPPAPGGADLAPQAGGVGGPVAGPAAEVAAGAALLDERQPGVQRQDPAGGGAAGADAPVRPGSKSSATGAAPRRRAAQVSLHGLAGSVVRLPGPPLKSPPAKRCAMNGSSASISRTRPAEVQWAGTTRPSHPVARNECDGAGTEATVSTPVPASTHRCTVSSSCWASACMCGGAVRSRRLGPALAARANTSVPSRYSRVRTSRSTRPTASSARMA